LFLSALNLAHRAFVAFEIFALAVRSSPTSITSSQTSVRLRLYSNKFPFMSTPLRQLPSASAWNEAMRRAMVISIGGFFVPNLLANFGVIPQLHESFQFLPGICGAAGVFFATMALFLGYLHQKWILGIAASIAGLVHPAVSPPPAPPHCFQRRPRTGPKS
jgi:hypothetical protein